VDLVGVYEEAKLCTVLRVAIDIERKGSHLSIEMRRRVSFKSSSMRIVPF
jgi:hypothetical protein